MFIFIPIFWGNDEQFDEHIFQKGWFNHQLVCFGIFGEKDPRKIHSEIRDITPDPMIQKLQSLCEEERIFHPFDFWEFGSVVETAPGSFDAAETTCEFGSPSCAIARL